MPGSREKLTLRFAFGPKCLATTGSEVGQLFNAVARLPGTPVK